MTGQYVCPVVTCVLEKDTNTVPPYVVRAYMLWTPGVTPMRERLEMGVSQQALTQEQFGGSALKDCRALSC
jgi:hypothetical protein